MSLLLFLGKNRECHIPLRRDMIPYFPWYTAVNRVGANHNDPFIVEPTLPTIMDVKKNYKDHKLKDLMDWRANQLLTLDKPMFVMWSGGIDSTATLLALIDNATPQHMENMYILCSSESIREYPEMYVEIQKTFAGRILSSYEHPVNYTKHGVIITGEFGDQINGSDMILDINYHLGWDYVFKPWQETMPLIYEKMFGPNNIVERYEPTIHESLYPIKTAFDWCWWFNFTNKWHHIKYRILGWDGWGDDIHTFWNMLHFYEPIEFQQWSMGSPHLKIKDDLLSYKFGVKEYIVSQTEHEEYILKPKVASMQNLWRMKKVHYGITPQLEYLTDEEIKQYVNK